MRRLILALLPATVALRASGAELQTPPSNPMADEAADAPRVAKKTSKPAKKTKKAASRKKTKKASTSKK